MFLDYMKQEELDVVQVGALWQDGLLLLMLLLLVMLLFDADAARCRYCKNSNGVMIDNIKSN